MVDVMGNRHDYENPAVWPCHFAKTCRRAFSGKRTRLTLSWPEKKKPRMNPGLLYMAFQGERDDANSTQLKPSDDVIPFRLDGMKRRNWTRSP